MRQRCGSIWEVTDDPKEVVRIAPRFSDNALDGRFQVLDL